MTIRNNHMLLREKIMRLLDGLSGKRIIYICAPAGYGKTVAVRQWLDQSASASGIISLDEYDNEPARICSRFCSALRRCQTENTVLKEIISHFAFESAPVEFTLRAIDTLSAMENAKLCIDDLHLVHDERTLHLIMSLLNRLPGCFQAVLASRNDPPFAFSELWRDGNDIAYITADDLRFSRDEIKLLCEERELPVTPDRAGDIYRYTNGWAIGIGAVLLSGGNLRGESLEFLEEFIETNVWQQWDAEIREFILQTSVVLEMIPSLCTALTGRRDSENLLSELVQQNAFILKTEQGSYRYHHLFHDFLRHILERRDKEFARSLLKKAGHWYLESQDFYNAVDYFIKCGDYDGIAQCIDFLEEFDRNSFIIDRTLPIFRSQVILSAAERYPFLYLMTAWAAFAEGCANDMLYCIDNYYARYPEIAQRAPALAYNIFYVRIMDFRAPLNGLIQEIGALPYTLETVGGRSSITMNMPLVHRCTRDFSEWAVQDVEAALAQIKAVLGGLFGEEAGLLFECMTAGLLYEQGKLEQARNHALAANQEIKAHFVPESKFCAMSILIYVLEALGQNEPADKVSKQITDMIEQERAYYLNYNFSALKTRRKLVMADITAADKWLKEHGISLHDGLDFYRLYGHITTCRAHIIKGEYDAAILVLTKVMDLATAYSRPLDIMETQILLSIAYWKKGSGFQEDAIRYLEQALRIANEYGYTQLFVNEGSKLFDMLLLLQKRKERQNSSEAIPIALINTLCQKARERYKGNFTGGFPTTSEKYTNKQLTVMRLLCDGKSQREIAEAMGIKHPTLRSHIAVIYEKLDVDNETDAVVKIKALGIL